MSTQCKDPRRVQEPGRITFRVKRDKFVICKDGAFLALTAQQVWELNDVLDEILRTDRLWSLTKKENKQ